MFRVFPEMIIMDRVECGESKFIFLKISSPFIIDSVYPLDISIYLQAKLSSTCLNYHFLSQFYDSFVAVAYSIHHQFLQKRFPFLC